MTTTPEVGRWDALVATRTRGEVGDGIASVLAFLGVPDLISFAGGFPDPETFPRERVSTLFQELAATEEAAAFQYAPTRGLAGLLDALAARLETLQGRRPADDELMVTSGAIEALELVGKSFLDPGDLVVVEAPTYLGSIQAFRSFEATLVAVGMDEHGLDVEELERRLAGGLRPKLVYSIPDHQNPAGVSLAAERRTLLVELAQPLRVPDRRGRGVPRALLLGGVAPEPLEPRARHGRADGHDVEDVLPGCPARLGGRPGRHLRATRLCQAEHRPVRGRARTAAVRGVVRRGWIDEQLVLSRALYQRKCARMLAALERWMPRELAGRGRTAASSPG